MPPAAKSLSNSASEIAVGEGVDDGVDDIVEEVEIVGNEVLGCPGRGWDIFEDGVGDVSRKETNGNKQHDPCRTPVG